MVLVQSKKDKGVHCCAYGCTEKPVPKKGGLCHKHYRRKRRKKDPVYVRYNQFKGNAKKRGFTANNPDQSRRFTITLKEFRAFCERTGYIIDKGRRGYSATIDRRCNAHGYHIWNIQLLTHSQNCRKGNRFSEPNFKGPYLEPTDVWEVGEIPF